MAENDQNKKSHFLLGNLAKSEPFRPPKLKIEPVAIPSRGRQAHGSRLLGQLKGVKPAMVAACEAQKEIGLEEGLGLRLEFESFADIDLAFESLARDRSGIELLNVRQEGDITFATVFVPEGKLLHFERLIEDYLAEKRNKNGGLLDHSKLINTIKEIRAASLLELWTDDQQVFPEQDDEMLWWEV